MIYCSGCGTKLVSKSERVLYYNHNTGEPVQCRTLVCPNQGKWWQFWRSHQIW